MCKLLVHPTQIDHAVDLPDQMIRRHYIVEIKRVKELPLSALSPPHHGPLPRITSQSDGITVRLWSQREFCNTFGGKADMRCGVAAQRRSAGNEVHIEVSHCFQASSLGTHLKAKSHRWVCERMRSPGHVATLLFAMRG